MNQMQDDTTRLLKLNLPLAPTVLIVDDDELVLARLKDLVAAAGYRVRTTSSGLDALDWLQTSSASIVVTDLNMPAIGGLELCRRIRALERREYVYIILLTVSDEEKHILAGLEAGADDYISKRTSSAQFAARLRTANRVLALEYSLQSALDKKNQLAMTDELTGVYNRRYFLRRLGMELKRRKSVGGDVSILLIDVDHFKKVNDTLGHAVGDAVLKGLTRQIAECLRGGEADWCARLGGEEFVIVLEGTGLAEARACAERVRCSLANCSFNTSGGAVRITVSIGISGFEENPNKEDVTPLSLLASADKNLFASKAGGRNRVTWWNPGSTPNTADKSAIPRAMHVNSKA